MKIFILPAIGASCILIGASCTKNEASPQEAVSCAGESVLAVYQDQPAIITMTQLDTYCLIVDSAAIATGSYKLDEYLVPSTALPPHYRVGGLRVVFSGRKKSCYGLTTLPNLRATFGYKLEVNAIRAK